ncbi:MAG: site-2 protease family protein [Candidatus Microgenomates bacterium]|jgi:Zn-dependent protease
MILYLIFAFVVAITVHEFSHAWLADQLGDPNPRLKGRLSLNPLAHFDPVGSVLVPLVLILVHFPFIFGWAKPVPVEPSNFRDPKKDFALVSLAGPASNLSLAIIFSIILRLFISPLSVFYPLFTYLITTNVVLAIFNLIPVYPLDGGGVLKGLLPYKEAVNYEYFMQRFGLIILVLLIFPTFGGNSLISLVISPIINFIIGLLGVR